MTMMMVVGTEDKGMAGKVRIQSIEKATTLPVVVAVVAVDLPGVIQHLLYLTIRLIPGPHTITMYAAYL